MKPVLRFLLDIFYVLIFVCATALAAAAVHFLAKLLESIGVDGVIIVTFHWLARILYLVDCIGVLCGAGFSIVKFILSLISELNDKGDNDKSGTA